MNSQFWTCMFQLQDHPHSKRNFIKAQGTHTIIVGDWKMVPTSSQLVKVQDSTSRIKAFHLGWPNLYCSFILEKVAMFRQRGHLTLETGLCPKMRVHDAKECFLHSCSEASATWRTGRTVVGRRWLTGYVHWSWDCPTAFHTQIQQKRAGLSGVSHS